VAAERDEFRGLLRRVSPPVRLQWHLDYSAAAETKTGPVLLVANGAGAGLAGEAADVARARSRIGAVVSFGFCGALNPALGPGDVIVGTTVNGGGERYPAMAPRTKRQYRTGGMVSVDHVIGAREEKQALHATGGDAVEMEAVALARRAKNWNVPFYCVRAVTDGAAEDFIIDFNAARSADGRIRRWKIVMGALGRPARGVPELLQLRRRSREASERLGEFFVDCEF